MIMILLPMLVQDIANTFGSYTKELGKTISLQLESSISCAMIETHCIIVSVRSVLLIAPIL